MECRFCTRKVVEDLGKHLLDHGISGASICTLCGKECLTTEMFQSHESACDAIVELQYFTLWNGEIRPANRAFVSYRILTDTGDVLPSRNNIASPWTNTILVDQGEGLTYVDGQSGPVFIPELIGKCKSASTFALDGVPWYQLLDIDHSICHGDMLSVIVAVFPGDSSISKHITRVCDIAPSWFEAVRELDDFITWPSALPYLERNLNIPVGILSYHDPLDFLPSRRKFIMNIQRSVDTLVLGRK